MKLTEEDLTKILEAKKKKPYLRYQQLAEEYGVESGVALKTMLQEYVQQKNNVDIFNDLTHALPLNKHLPKFNRPLTVTKSALIIGDVHTPFVNVPYLESMLNRCVKRGITHVIINGDFFDGTSTKQQFVDSYTSSLVEDLQVARNILARFHESGITEVTVVTGNHDSWVLDFLNIKYDALLKKLFSDMKYRVTEYPYVYFENDIIIGHLEKFHAVPGFLALEIAKKHQRHALVHHDHIRGVQIDNDRNLYGISVGCMLDVDLVWYKASSFNDMPEWKNGSAIIHDGSIDLYNLDEMYLRIMR